MTSILDLIIILCVWSDHDHGWERSGAGKRHRTESAPMMKAMNKDKGVAISSEWGSEQKRGPKYECNLRWGVPGGGMDKKWSSQLVHISVWNGGLIVPLTSASGQ